MDLSRSTRTASRWTGSRPPAGAAARAGPAPPPPPPGAPGAGGGGVAVLGGAPTLRSCTVQGGTTGLHMSGESTAGLVQDCRLSGGGTGIALVGGTTATVRGCTLEGQAEYGILVGEGARPIV